MLHYCFCLLTLEGDEDSDKWLLDFYPSVNGLPTFLLIVIVTTVLLMWVNVTKGFDETSQIILEKLYYYIHYLRYSLTFLNQ